MSSLLSLARFLVNAARVISLAGRMIDRSGLTSGLPNLGGQGEFDLGSTEQAQDTNPHGGRYEKPVKSPKKSFGRRQKTST